MMIDDMKEDHDYPNRVSWDDFWLISAGLTILISDGVVHSDEMAEFRDNLMEAAYWALLEGYDELHTQEFTQPETVLIGVAKALAKGALNKFDAAIALN